MAYKLENSGLKREAAVSEAKAFVSSLPEQEAAKLTQLIGNDEVMSRIVQSLKKHAGASSLPVPADRNAEKTEIEKNKTEKISNSDPQNVHHHTAQQSRQAVQHPVANPARASENSAVKSQELHGELPVRRSAPIKNVQSSEHPERFERNVSVPVQNENAAGMNPEAQRVRRSVPQRPEQNVQRQPKAQTPVQRTAAEKGKNNRRNDRQIIYRPDPNADYRKFYTILACSSPLLILLAAAGLFLFLAVLGGMCLSIVLLIIGLIAGVALGTVLCLVGIIYGITQLFKYAPIGLYEIGLGLMIGGITMLAGIIIYNVAVRLLPFLIKKVFSLLIYSMHKCVELYFYVKGACADL